MKHLIYKINQKPYKLFYEGYRFHYKSECDCVLVLFVRKLASLLDEWVRNLI